MKNDRKQHKHVKEAKVRKDQRQKEQRQSAEDLPTETPSDARPENFPGIVVTSHGYMADIAFEDGTHRMCHMQLGKKTRVVVGDRVRIRDEHVEIPIVCERMPRKTSLTRRVTDGKTKIIAANVDRIIAVASVSPPLREGLLDRYIVAAESAGIEPVLVLNKIDLDEDGDAQKRMKVFTDLGYQVHCISALTGQGLEKLSKDLTGHAVAVVGASGVGKSTIINRLLPEANLETGDISKATGKGKHVTTVSTLHFPVGGGFIVDSPGIRAFAIAGFELPEVQNYFTEFAAYREQCQFDDCLHRVEEGCAVLAALEAGKISSRRHESYLRILASIESGEWE